MMILELTSEQRERIDAFIEEESVCICGKKLFVNQSKALIGQPKTRFAIKNPGHIEVIALCEKCIHFVQLTLIGLSK